jgi:hypothetical protein
VRPDYAMRHVRRVLGPLILHVFRAQLHRIYSKTISASLRAKLGSMPSMELNACLVITHALHAPILKPVLHASLDMFSTTKYALENVP